MIALLAAEEIDRNLAAALRGEPLSTWPEEMEAAPDLLLQRTHYHGLCGLLAASASWPPSIDAAIRREAVARAMWELRHRQLMEELLSVLEAAGVRALLLKGTALAYLYYEEPAHRSRGDTDLWVAPQQVEPARRVLAEHGFACTAAADPHDPMQLEEGWAHGADGQTHIVDLHWSAVNSLALSSLFDFDTCWSRRQGVIALGSGAWALDDADALLHAAVHRRLHVASPYLVDGRTYYGGDRLIWAKDIDLLVRRLGDCGMERAAERARELGLAEAFREALVLARDCLSSPIPRSLLERTAEEQRGRVAAYLAAGQVGRARLDLLAVPGPHRKLAAVAHRILPSRQFLKAKYGQDGRTFLPLLLFRRLTDFARKRPASTSG